jgi:hypothetical protein
MSYYEVDLSIVNPEDKDGDAIYADIIDVNVRCVSMEQLLWFMEQVSDITTFRAEIMKCTKVDNYPKAVVLTPEHTPGRVEEFIEKGLDFLRSYKK